MASESSAAQRQRSRSFIGAVKETDHLVSIDSLCARLGSSLRHGLSSKRVKEILRTHGPNTLSRPTGKGKDRHSMRMKNGKPSMPADDWSDREWHEVFVSRLHQTFSVLRDGDSCVAHGSELVTGDVIFMFKGETVPVDARIVSANDLVVDNRIITGIAAERKSAQASSPDVLLSANMIFAGTQILSGDCSALVLKRGDDTVYATLIQFARKVEFVRRNSLTRTRAPSWSSDATVSSASSGSPPASPKRTLSRGVKGSLSRAFARQRERLSIRIHAP